MIFASFGVYRAVMPRAMMRSRFDFPDSTSPITMKCGSASKSTSTGERVFSSMPMGTAARARSTGGKWLSGRSAGSSRTSGAAGPDHAPGHPLDHGGHAVHEVVDGRVAVDAGQRGEEVQLVRAQPTSWATRRHVRRRTAIDVGFGGVAQAQLQPAADQVAKRRTNLHPALNGQHDVQGLADEVDVPSGKAALVVQDNNSATRYVIAEPGEKFAASAATLGALGYASATPARLPSMLLLLIPTGPPFDTGAARQPVSGMSQTAASTLYSRPDQYATQPQSRELCRFCTLSAEHASRFWGALTSGKGERRT